MDFNHLRAFVLVADELNMGRAAQRLGVAQPAVSQQMKLLEQRLQGRLFDRSGKSLTLTALGRTLLPEARAAIELSSRALDLGEKAGRGAVGTLRVSFVDSAVFGAPLRSLLASFQVGHPGVALELVPNTVARQLAALGESSIDFGFVRGPLPPLPHTIQARPFAQDGLSLAVSCEHQLAGKEGAKISDLAGERLILSRDPDGVGLSGQVCLALRQAGIKPRIAYRVHETATMSAMVAGGAGTAVLPSTLTVLDVAGVRFLPLVDMAPSELLIIYRTAEERPAALAMLKYCQQAAAPSA